MGRNPQIGRAVRRRLYAWATAPGTQPALGAAVADACGRELGRRYPRNALTRLRHLARHADALVTDAVAAALVRLAEDSGLRGQVLDEVADWLRSPDVGRRQAAAAAFVKLAGTVDDGGVPILLNARPEGVGAGWRHVLGITGGGECFREGVPAGAERMLEAGGGARAALDLDAAADAISTPAPPPVGRELRERLGEP